MIEKIKSDLEHLVYDHPIFIHNVVYEKEGENNFLRVVINSTDIEIDLDICVDITRIVNEYLDSNDPISEEYTLEVSSKGIEDDITTVEEIENAVGSFVFVKTYSKVENRKEFFGNLLELNDDSIIIECNEKSVLKKYRIKLSLIAHMRYSVEF
ncbi:MAG: ribosome maturation factor RimP [Bacilli bacterium]